MAFTNAKENQVGTKTLSTLEIERLQQNSVLILVLGENRSQIGR